MRIDPTQRATRQRRIASGAGALATTILGISVRDVGWRLVPFFAVFSVLGWLLFYRQSGGRVRWLGWFALAAGWFGLMVLLPRAQASIGWTVAVAALLGIGFGAGLATFRKGLFSVGSSHEAIPYALYLGSAAMGFAAGYVASSLGPLLLHTIVAAGGMATAALVLVVGVFRSPSRPPLSGLFASIAALAGAAIATMSVFGYNGILTQCAYVAGGVALLALVLIWRESREYS
jgi:hypothetical protein